MKVHIFCFSIHADGAIGEVADNGAEEQLEHLDTVEVEVHEEVVENQEHVEEQQDVEDFEEDWSVEGVVVKLGAEELVTEFGVCPSGALVEDDRGQLFPGHQERYDRRYEDEAPDFDVDKYLKRLEIERWLHCGVWIRMLPQGRWPKHWRRCADQWMPKKLTSWQ
ncbi:hypothetical protein B9Z55_028770 [Caenorhabditis nigoni]|uniref:Uncharacterized protein n=1 Tax=Caenorhabditis nigoni TaxID=1611254 RepID=A0A2G5SAH3_9PELO|nr:hypothetical protein B9Z55_028770 [Caenorhabditis nigoni]